MQKYVATWSVKICQDNSKGKGPFSKNDTVTIYPQKWTLALDLNVKFYTIKLLEENIGENLSNHGFSKDSLTTTQKI